MSTDNPNFDNIDWQKICPGIDMNSLDINWVKTNKEYVEARVHEEADRVVEYLNDHPTDNWMPNLIIDTRASKEDKVERMYMALAMNFDDHEVKRKIMRKIGNQLYEEKTFPITTIVTAEAWAAPATGTTMPRDHKDRKEVIVVSGCNLMLDNCSSVIPVKRGKNNCFVQAGDVEHIDQSASGLLEHLITGFFQAVGSKFGFDMSGGVLRKKNHPRRSTDG